MEMNELLDLVPEELIREEKKLRKELFHLRFQLIAGRVENQMKVREVRRNIARVKTVHRQQVLKSAKEQKSAS